MSLIYSLHSLGMGTCPLNWSKNHDVDRRMRREARIADNEVVIMMIAVGHLPPEFNVARSSRNDLKETLVIH